MFLLSAKHSGAFVGMMCIPVCPKKLRILHCILRLFKNKFFFNYNLSGWVFYLTDMLGLLKLVKLRYKGRFPMRSQTLLVIFLKSLLSSEANGGFDRLLEKTIHLKSFKKEITINSLPIFLTFLFQVRSFFVNLI